MTQHSIWPPADVSFGHKDNDLTLKTPTDFDPAVSNNITEQGKIDGGLMARYGGGGSKNIALQATEQTQ